MTVVQLTAWIIAASAVASGGARKLNERTAKAMAEEAVATRMVDADERPILAMAAVEVSLAWSEAANLQDPRGSGIGSSDHGQSWCWGQIYLPGGGRTQEGWSGPELAADPTKCAHVVVRLIKASFLASPACDGCGLTVYARGRDSAEGRRLSQMRMALARRLVADVPVPPP